MDVKHHVYLLTTQVVKRVSNTSNGFCGRKATFEEEEEEEDGIHGSTMAPPELSTASLTDRTVSMDVKQHSKKKKTAYMAMQ